MLQSLLIKNYAIIEQLQLDFNNDFTVITGETGAGKSILLGALSLILGQRADVSVLNDKTKKCMVEGSFIISETKFRYFFEQHELDFETPTVIRREISDNGKSRAFINDTPVNLIAIKELATALFDIHSQHQTLELNSSDFQLEVVDSFAVIIDETVAYQQAFKSYQQLKREYEQLVNKEVAAKNDMDYLLFQINELVEFKLQPNEQQEIEGQLEIINNAEQIINALELTSNQLLASEDNIVGKLTTITSAIGKIAHCSDAFQQLHERLTSALIELKDIAVEAENELTSMDVDVSKAEYLNNRLNAIYSLTQKHRLQNSNELVELQKQLELQLLEINLADDKIKQLQTEIEQTKKELLKEATILSNKRKACFKELEKNITSNLTELGMKDAIFKVNQTVNNQLTEKGIDIVDFLFSANKGFAPKSLSKTASGGELSRLMLTIKSILAKNSSIQTIVFDEIDTGVSGDIAYKMASIMQQMSKKIQIIAITHLPQVAAKGNTHFKIYKENNKEKTLTLMKKLSLEDRVDEIAKMLSGKELTNAAKENAKNLLAID